VFKSRLRKVLASRTRLALALGAVVAVAAIGVPITAGAAAAATGSARSAAVTPSRAAPFPASIGAFHCWSASNCIAVGANSPQMATQLIAERWNGTRWTRSTMPKPAGAQMVTIGGISCPSRTECVAVGAGYPPATSKATTFPLVEYWNGARWTAGRAAVVGPEDLFAAVACPAAKSCFAVGDYTPKGTAFTPLIEHWNGKGWARQAASIPRGTSDAEVTAVSCASAKFCVAVGEDGNGVLIERWNGTSWVMAAPRSAPSATLYGVSCPSAASCFAVGSNLTQFGGSLVERWNGKGWSASATPVPKGASFAGLASVSCVSASHCVAVGNDVNPGVYAAVWNGRGWRLAGMTTTGGRIGAFYAVGCLAASSCMAIGATTQFAASARSESALWNGTRWKVALTA